jgi:hypothetical protein
MKKGEVSIEDIWKDYSTGGLDVNYALGQDEIQVFV